MLTLDVYQYWLFLADVCVQCTYVLSIKIEEQKETDRKAKGRVDSRSFEMNGRRNSFLLYSLFILYFIDNRVKQR